jgi:hypothetical protein
MRMFRISMLAALVAALVPGVALAGHGGKPSVEGKPPWTLRLPSPPAPPQQVAIYVVKGTITGPVTASGFPMSVTKTNDAAAKALGGQQAQAGPINPPVALNVTVDANTRIFRTAWGRKHDDSKYSKDRKGPRGFGFTTDLASLQQGDEVKVEWMAAPGLTAATLATTAARKVIAKGTPPPKPVKFKIKGTVATLPVPGAPTFWVDPSKVNGNAAKALNPANPAIKGGVYDLSGLVPVTIDGSTKVKVTIRGRHWGHHRSWKKGQWKLALVRVGDWVEVEWKAPALSSFWTQPARKVEFKSKFRHR